MTTYPCPDEYTPGFDLCTVCPWDGDNCPNWIPWGDTFDTVRAPPEILAAKAVIKEVERVVRLKQAAIAKGKTSKATVKVDKLAYKFKLDRDIVLQAVGAVMLEPEITVQKLSLEISTCFPEHSMV